MKTLASTLIAAAVALASPAWAEETGNVLDLSIGAFDTLDDGNTLEAHVEWRGKPLLWWLRPMVGVMGTADRAIYPYAGLAFELWWPAMNMVLTPSAAIGSYWKGDGKDLGGVLEFRVGAALHHRFANDVRLGVAFYHISNAGTGHKNPGEESLMFSYAVPLDRLLGK